MLLSQDPDKSEYYPGGAAGASELTRSTANPQDNHELTASAIPSHPRGIKPLGNQFLASGPTARESLGSLGNLPDEMLMQVFEYLDSKSVVALSATCRFLYACCISDDLWKALFLEVRYAPSDFTWRGSWRNTVLNIPAEQGAQIDCRNVYSDVLHRPFACSHIVLKDHTSSIPPANQIQRFEDLSYDEFAQKWSNKPFILTRTIQSWPVHRKWTMQKLAQQYPDVEFRAESVDWPFSTYMSYMAHNDDESPLYLFDRRFAEKMKLKVGHSDAASYWPPECFGPDLFEVLGQERPAHRWLIIGPERSGSTFHKDPNATSAWNAVIEGSKYWIMFPPTTQVPGVFVSADSSEVTSPLSIAEWLLEFHSEARQQLGCIEGICQAGEILHVPSGWWHLVVNLEPGIALTQNFVPKSHLTDVLLFLRDKADQVTGFNHDIESPYELFSERLRAKYPELHADALAEMDRRGSSRKRRWEDAVGGPQEDTNQGGGFSFGFGGDDEDEIP